MSLIGSTGAAYADDHHNSHLLFAGGAPNALLSDASVGHLMDLQEFIACITCDQSPDIELQTVRRLWDVANGIELALKESQAVHQQGGVYAAV